MEGGIGVAGEGRGGRGEGGTPAAAAAAGSGPGTAARHLRRRGWQGGIKRRAAGAAGCEGHWASRNAKEWEV